MGNNNKKEGKKMKTVVNGVQERANKLILVAKEKNLVKPHTSAFKTFPVEEETHKGKTEYYK